MRLYQIDVKSAFLNGAIQEVVHVEQPHGFEGNTFPHHVFKLNKALYGLKQALRAWYECISSFLLSNGFERGKRATSRLYKNYDSQFIFGATNELCEDFSKLMQAEFKISMMGELKFFLGLHIKQTNNAIYIHQTMYVKELLKKFKLEDAREMKTHMHPTACLGLDEESNKVDNSQYTAMRNPDLTYCSVLDYLPDSNKTQGKFT